MPYFLRYLKLLFRPVRLIVFIGVNGSGKTTLVDKLKSSNPAYSTQLYLGWNKYFFKFIGRLDNHLELSSKSLQNMLNRLRLFLLYLLLPFEFFARYLSAKLKSQEGIVITDRYPLPKQNFDNYRKFSFQKLYKQLSLRLTHLLLPKPALLFVLVGQPEVIWARKKKSDYASFLIEYKRCLQAQELLNCPTHLINVDCPVDDSFNEIYKIISSHI